MIKIIDSNFDLNNIYAFRVIGYGNQNFEYINIKLGDDIKC